VFGDHEDHDREVADARAGLATSAAGAALGTAAGNGLAGTAVGALAGPALMLVRSTIDHARDTRERRAERALQIAADIIHRLNGINGIDFIGRWSATDGVRFDLLVEVIEAAVHTPLQAKIEALAEVLVEGLQTDGAAHKGRILAAALADIEVPHIAVLGFLRDKPLPPENLRKPDHPEPRGWEAPQIGQALPQLGKQWAECFEAGAHARRPVRWLTAGAAAARRTV
jgi:hypothetical protein